MAEDDSRVQHLGGDNSTAEVQEDIWVQKWWLVAEGGDGTGGGGSRWGMVILPFVRVLCSRALYISPLTPRALGLECQPCSGPWLLKFSDCQLIVVIMGVWGSGTFASQAIPQPMDHCFVLYLSWNCLGESKAC